MSADKFDNKSRSLKKRTHLTGASGESKRKEESSEEEEARKEGFTKDARKEAYTKAQSMKSLFQQGQIITTRRWQKQKSRCPCFKK